MAFERITVDPDRMGGVPCIAIFCVTASMVLGQLVGGRTIENVVADYPYLERDDVLAALEYASVVVNEARGPRRPSRMRLLTDASLVTSAPWPAARRWLRHNARDRARVSDRERHPHLRSCRCRRTRRGHCRQRLRHAPRPSADIEPDPGCRTPPRCRVGVERATELLLANLNHRGGSATRRRRVPQPDACSDPRPSDPLMRAGSRQAALRTEIGHALLPAGPTTVRWCNG